MPSTDKPLAETATFAVFFALHTSAPYVNECRSFGTSNLHQPLTGRGYSEYMSDLCELYPDGYTVRLQLECGGKSLAKSVRKINSCRCCRKLLHGAQQPDTKTDIIMSASRCLHCTYEI